MSFHFMRILSVSSFSYLCFFFFFKQKTAYEMRISDWSSDVCSSDLTADAVGDIRYLGVRALVNGQIIAETTAAGMQHDVVQVLTHISAGETLYPGEEIGRAHV